jgi:hypothetical protein
MKGSPRYNSSSRTVILSIFGAAMASALLLSGCDPKATPSADMHPDDGPQIIEPGKGMGKIRLGMATTQIVEQIGEPQRKTSNSLEYTDHGFAVMPDAEGFARVIMCGDVTGSRGPLVAKFKGRTASGIGMGSTREEALKAFGQPTTEETHPGGRVSLDYKNLGMTFSLEAGKVHHIIVRLGEEFQNAPGVEIENKK